ncbi:MAG: glycosyltransferase, partial [Cyclobacteriaceae bacterium]
EYLLAIAEESLQKGLPVKFTIIGEGAEREKIARLVEPLSNITILPFVDREGLKPIIDRHDAFYVSFMNIDVLHTGCPNKYFDGLAAGKLMILNLGGWLKELTEYNNCGFAYDPENPTEFIDKLMPYLENEALVFTAQENAHMLAREYSVTSIQRKMISFIEES